MSEQPKCTLRDAELLADVEKWVSKLCDTGGSAWTLSVPINFNRDPDMLITELCKRYAALLARHNALLEAVAWERECEAVRNWLRPYRHWPELAEAVGSYGAARAEVDRLLNEGVDCKGEG